MSPPVAPKLYHIVHVDRLPSIISTGGLLCDIEIVSRAAACLTLSMGTTIGMQNIKDRRMNELTLASHPDLYVGQCVPFYFCPRSVMLYVIHKANHPDLTYDGGQNPIIHLEADLYDTVAWAKCNRLRWAFTLSNASSRSFKDRADLGQLDEINWDAVQATHWSGNNIPSSVKKDKQAEFLLEQSFPWQLVTRIGVHSPQICKQVRMALQQATDHKPGVAIMPTWYY